LDSFYDKIGYYHKIMNNNLHKKSTNKSVNRITTMTVASIYPHYVAKIENKGRTKQELHQVLNL